MRWDPAGQIEDLAQRKLNTRLGLKKELRTLPSHLAENEEVLNLSSGLYDGASGLVVLTDRRVIFISASLTKSRFEDFPYSKVSSVQHSSRVMFGELVIFASGNRAELKQMLKDRAKEIADYIRDRIGDGSAIEPVPSASQDPVSAAASSEEVFSKIKQLGELRDAGIITPEDFDAKKEDLLSRL